MPNLGLGGPKIIMHRLAGNGGQRFLGDEARPARGQDGGDTRPRLARKPREFQRLIRRDGARDDQQDFATRQHGAKPNPEAA